MGPAVTAISAMYGKPNMPHQRHIANVALELDPGTGRLIYDEVVIVIGRQQGKTRLILPTLTHRALGMPGKRSGWPGIELPPQVMVYTTQTADKAREKWRDVYVAEIVKSPFAEMVAYGSPRLTRNFELFTFTNGSTFAPVSPSPETGATGDSLDLAFIDEAWAQQGTGVEQSFSPTMITRQDAQLWITSTAKRQPKGQPHNPNFASYLRAKIAAGRARVEAGVTRGTAYFEWSAPEDADPHDPDTWWGCLPALGHTTTEEAIAAQLGRMDLGDFCSEFLSWWPSDAQLRWKIIPKLVWEGLADRGLSPGYPLAFAVDTSPDRGMSAIVSAGPAPGGLWAIELVEYRPGADWVPERMRQLSEQWRPCAVAVAGTGAAGSLIEPLQRVLVDEAKAEVKPMSIPEMARAYGTLHDAAVQSGILRHRGQSELDTSVSMAWPRRIGAQTLIDWASPGDVSPIVAATEALWAAQEFGPAQQAVDYDLLKSVW